MVGVMRGLIRDPNFIKWFYFGMHIKRWLLLLLLGVAIMGLGIGYFLREVYVSYTFPGFVYYLTLQFFPRWLRGALFVSASFGIIGFAVWKLNQSLLSAFIKPERNESIVDIIYNHRYLRRGPKIVAIGGGPSQLVMSVNLSVIRYEWLRPTGKRHWLLHLAIPALGFAVCFYIWLHLSRFALALGGLWLAVGFFYLLFLTRGFRQHIADLKLE